VCDLVQLRHRFADLTNASGLLEAWSAELTDEVVDALHLRDDASHGLAGFIDQTGAAFDLLDALADAGLDILGRLGAALGEASHFAAWGVPGLERVVLDAKEGEQLALQLGQLQVEDLDGASVLEQMVALGQAEQARHLLCSVVW
jgi:hypothetical protein